MNTNMEEVFRTSQEFISSVEDSNSPSPVETEEHHEDDSAMTENAAVVPKDPVHKFQDYIWENVHERAHESIDDVIKTVLGSYSLAGYLDHVLPTGKEIIITKLLKECSHLMQELTKASDSICFTHEDPFTALIQLIQLQLLNHYPKYSTQGYEALYSCPPTIYVSTLCLPSLALVISKKLGIPSNYVKVMKMTSNNLNKLEKSLLEDVAAKRVPVMVIASSGSHHTGQSDDLVKICQLCQRFKIWLHLEGHLISQLSLKNHPNKNLQVADSIHFDMRLLLGIPSLPYVTMYRHCEIALQRAASLTPSNCSPYTVLPLWFALQTLEIETIRKRIQLATDLCVHLVKHLVTIPTISVVSYVPGAYKMSGVDADTTLNKTDSGDSNPAEETINNEESKVSQESDSETDHPPEADTSSSSDDDAASDDENSAKDSNSILSNKKEKPETLMDGIPTVVVFQYRSKDVALQAESNYESVLNDLNLWLVQVLEGGCKEIRVDMIDSDEHGYALRFSPYDYTTTPTIENLARFLQVLDQQIEILNATILHKSTLKNVIANYGELQLVELPGWAGLGGVRYLPSTTRQSSSSEVYSDQAKEEINKINKELVNKLKEIDSAFSVGEGKDGLLCVRFGMVVAETDVEGLCNLVLQTGVDIETSALALETMAVLVRKGIEEAQAELQRETEEKIWQEGLLRHIPIVGSLVNYFSPPPKTQVKGRSLNLQSGKVETIDVSNALLATEHKPAPNVIPEVYDVEKDNAEVAEGAEIAEVAQEEQSVQQE